MLGLLGKIGMLSLGCLFLSFLQNLLEWIFVDLLFIKISFLFSVALSPYFLKIEAKSLTLIILFKSYYQKINFFIDVIWLFDNFVTFISFLSLFIYFATFSIHIYFYLKMLKFSIFSFMILVLKNLSLLLIIFLIIFRF